MYTTVLIYVQIQFFTNMFHVNHQTLQRGRGLGGVLANLFKRAIPFGKTLAKAAINTGRQFAQSEAGQDIINDTISSTATAAKHALLNNDSKKAKEEIINSLKRSGKKSKRLVKRIVKQKLDKVLNEKEKRKKKNTRRKKVSLLDD